MTVETLAAAMCREPARGRRACYSCRSAAKRLIDSGVLSQPVTPWEEVS